MFFNDFLCWHFCFVAVHSVIRSFPFTKLLSGMIVYNWFFQYVSNDAYLESVVLTALCLCDCTISLANTSRIIIGNGDDSSKNKKKAFLSFHWWWYLSVQTVEMTIWKYIELSLVAQLQMFAVLSVCTFIFFQVKWQTKIAELYFYPESFWTKHFKWKIFFPG